MIFRFWNGTEWVDADPMILWKRLAEKGADLEIASKVAASESKDAMKAHGDVVRYVRDVFDLKKPEGLSAKGVLTETECLDLLDSYHMFCGANKKKENPTPTSATATSPVTAPTSDAVPPTPNGSVSGCADSVPPIVPVTSSIEASSSPLV
jgi:hypothetical protein